MVTAEFAVALPAIMVVLALCLGALSLVVDQVRCTDAARTGARALARGDHPESVRAMVTRLAPRGARLTFTRGRMSRVDVQAPPPALLGPIAGALTASAFGEAVTEDAGVTP